MYLFSGVAVAIAPRSCVVFSIGGVGYTLKCLLLRHSNNYFHRASSGVLFPGIDADSKLGSLVLMGNSNIL